jgi:hypothetical protein
MDGYKGLKVSGILKGTVTKANGAEKAVSEEFDTRATVSQGTDRAAGRARSSSSTSGGSTSTCSGSS